MHGDSSHAADHEALIAADAEHGLYCTMVLSKSLGCWLTHMLAGSCTQNRTFESARRRAVVLTSSILDRDTS
jgi:hypothetical protein